MAETSPIERFRQIKNSSFDLALVLKFYAFRKSETVEPHCKNHQHKINNTKILNVLTLNKGEQLT